MEPTTTISEDSKGRRWTARILAGIASLFIIFDGTIHLLVIQPVVDSFQQMGYPVELSVVLGILELMCLVLYLVPRTAVLGAVLMTGYLGGAVAVQLRIGAPLFSTALFPIYIGLMFWGGLYLVDERLRSLIPVRRP